MEQMWIMWINHMAQMKSMENSGIAGRWRGKEIHILNVYKHASKMWIMWIN